VAEGGVLPPAIQQFVANSEGWIAGINAMIAANDRLIESIAEVKEAGADLGLGADTGAAGAAGAVGAEGVAGAEAAAEADAAVAESADAAAAAEERQTAATDALSDAEAVAADAARLFAEVDAQMAEASAAVTSAMGVEASAIKTNAAAYAELADTAEVSDERIEAANDVTRDSSEGMGLGMKTAILAVAVAAGVGIDKAMEFQAQMTRLQTAAGLTGVNMAQVSQEVLQLGDKTGFAGDQIAEALYHPISAGLNLATSLKLVGYAAELAQIHGADLEDTTYALSSVMKAYNFGLGQVGHTAGLLNAIVGEGDMRFQDFDNSVQAWTPTMASMGISIQSAGAALDYLTDRGMNATSAATRLSMGLTMVTSGSEEANTFLKALGLTTGSVTLKNESLAAVMNHYGLTTNRIAAELKKPDGIYAALTSIKTAFEASGLSAAQANAVMSKIFGGGRSDKAIVDLMQNLGGVKTKYEDIGKAVGDFGSSWAKTEQTAHFHWTQFKADIGNIVTEFGMALLPTFTRVVGAISKLMGWLQDHPTIAKFAGAILALAGAAEIAGTVVGGLATAVGVLASPIVLIIALIIALAVGIYELWKHCKTFRDIVMDVAHALESTWKAAWHAAGDVIKWFENGPLKWIEQQIQAFQKFWQENGTEITKIAKAAWTIISDTFITYWNIIWAFIKAGFAVFEGFWKAGWTIIWDTVKIIVDVIGDLIHMWIQAILGIIQVGLDIIQGHWSAAGHELMTLTSQIWHDIGNIIKTIVGGFINMLFDAGKDIVQGFINGVKSMFGSVSGIMGDLGSMASGALKSVLSMFSPSRVFYEHGRNVVLGFVQGIQENSHLVYEAMQKMGAEAATGGALATASPRAGAVSAQQLNIKVDLSNAMSSPAWQQGLQKVIQTAVLDYSIRNPSNGLILPAKGR
jgi:TP901 family phage tail tape measure protein